MKAEFKYFRQGSAVFKSGRVAAILRGALTAIFVFALCPAGHAQTVPIAYDGFNYTGGAALGGQNGGTGWSTPWINDYTSGATLTVTTTGLTYTGLTTTGGSVVWGSGGNGISEDSRTLPLVDSGVVYFQFIAQFNGSTGGGTPNIRLSDSGALTGGFGGNGGSTMSILGTNLQPNGTTSSSNAALSNVSFVIARIDYANNDTEMWVNPNLSTFNYANPAATPDATYSGLAPAFNQVSIYTRNNGNVDEINIMAVPEPGPGALLAAGAGMVALWGWRRRNDRIRLQNASSA